MFGRVFRSAVTAVFWRVSGALAGFHRKEVSRGSGSGKKKWKKRILGLDSVIGPAYKPRSLPRRAAPTNNQRVSRTAWSLFEIVRSFGRDSRVAVRVNVSSFVNNKVSPMDL
jgi:hypothetical protein